MGAYLIVDITIHDPERYQEYVRQVQAFIEKHKGSYLVRGGEMEVKEGNWHPQRMIVLEFPDREHANGFLQDPGYQPVAAIRPAAASTNAVLADGYKGN